MHKIEICFLFFFINFLARNLITIFRVICWFPKIGEFDKGKNSVGEYDLKLNEAENSSFGQFVVA